MMPRVRQFAILIAINVLAISLIFLYTINSTINGWEPDKSRWIPAYVLPEEDTSLLQVQQGGCDPPTKTLIVVFSAPNNFQRRSTIRSTWGFNKYSDCRIVFLVGVDKINDGTQRKLEDESSSHNDIIQEDFIDSYYNLTLKAVMMLKHVNRYCKSVEYILKADDDVYVRVANLLQLTKTLTASSKDDVLVGYIMKDEAPIRNTHSKWFCPWYMYNDVYPTYLSGGSGYLMSRRSALKLYKSALFIPYLHLEDVFITGVVAEAAGIARTNHDGFNLLMNPEDLCAYTDEFIEKFITSHDISNDGIRILWAWIEHKFSNKPNCGTISILFRNLARIFGF